MQFEINRPGQSDEPRMALSRYVRGIAEACTDPHLAGQLNQIARHYENRVKDATLRTRQQSSSATDLASPSTDRHFALA